MIDLPDTPGPASVDWNLIDFGGNLTPPLGGAEQRINRLGNRWAATITMPPMSSEEARLWVARLTRGVREGVRFKLRQLGVDVGAPGSPTVNGGGQAGTALNITGATPRYALRVGQCLNIVTGGRRYLYRAYSPVVLGSSGNGTVGIEPPLRAQPANGDSVIIGAPVIEGRIEPLQWSVPENRLTVLQFTITERA